ncbi:hypothetical protein Tco_0598669 [Tanacetum coccineum]
MAVTNVEGKGHTNVSIQVEYEWKPPLCSECHVFGHNIEQCSKRIVKPVKANKEVNGEVKDDGFTTMNRRWKKGKKQEDSHAKQVVVNQINCRPLSDKQLDTAYRVILKNRTYRGLRSDGVVFLSDVPIGDGWELGFEVCEAVGVICDPIGLGIQNTTWRAIPVSRLQGTSSDKSMPKVNDANPNSCDKGEAADCLNLEKSLNRINNNMVDNINLVSLRNSFESIMENDKILDVNDKFDLINEALEDDEEEVEDFYVEKPPEPKTNVSKGLTQNLKIFVLKFLSTGIGHLMGDFNVSLHMDDKSTGTSTIDTGIRGFQSCVEEIKMLDVNRTGLKFTWNQKPHGLDGVLKKIDRIMANLNFSLSFVDACTIFQPYRISDHAPAVLRIPMLSITKPRPFKFSNILVHNVWFKEIMANMWQHSVSGFWMFKVLKHLKLLKKPLRELLYDHRNVCENVKKLRHELDEAQKSRDVYPSNIELWEEEAAYLQDFNAIIVKERFLMQKAKVEWLKLGDANTTYFHKIVKSQASRNHIDTVMTSNGDCVNGDQVPSAFINHYMDFLGQQEITSDFNVSELFCNQIPTNVAYNMVRDVSNQEVHKAIFCMGDNKASGPNGYSASFFKEAWDIISGDVIKAVKEFFVNRVLLKELNHTIIALIPKVTTPMRINDYRLISCTHRFAFKVDIHKAYDIVDWMFLKEILIGFGFHPRMIGWIMECVTSTYFSLSIIGNLHGYFKGKRGLCQGDPMSPYLFTLAMEVLTLMLHRRARDSDFTYHRYCCKLNIINLCFADDLFLFTHGDVESTPVIMNTLEDFKNASGKLPVKYLGMPLVPSRLLHRDCMELMEKVGNGTSISTWFDNWCCSSPFVDFISNRDIYRAGFGLSATVSDIVNDGSWCWPLDWSFKYPHLANVNVPNLTASRDRIV